MNYAPDVEAWPRLSPRRLLSALAVPVALKRFYKTHRDREFTFLDVGCGYHSPRRAKRYFPRCEYYGIDRGIVELDSSDMDAMKAFYQIDLDRDSLETVPVDSFDVVVMSHVIEHLRNGLQVLDSLATKLKPGGRIYLEFPSAASLATPRGQRGCLHFSDDATHVRLYSVLEVANVLLNRDFEIIAAGRRRDPMRLLLTPITLLAGLARGDIWSGGRGLWDLFGFADFVYARRKDGRLAC